jgi:hypothetical protein
MSPLPVEHWALRQAGVQPLPAVQPTSPATRPGATATLSPRTDTGQSRPRPTPCVPPPDLRPRELLATPQTCRERITTATQQARLAAPTSMPTLTPPARPIRTFEPPTPAAPTPPLLQFAPNLSALQAALLAIMGDPVEPAHIAGADCDLEQRTTSGLATWTCATGAATFVADADELRHWQLLEGALFEWLAPTAQLPDIAPLYDVPGQLTLVCVGPNDSRAFACKLPGSTVTAGVIASPGDTVAYSFDLTETQAEIQLELTELPADYDLYLADGSGAILAQSVQEGTVPEMVDAVLAPGRYFIYVYADPSRNIVATPFILRLAVSDKSADEPLP